MYMGWLWTNLWKLWISGRRLSTVVVMPCTVVPVRVGRQRSPRLDSVTADTVMTWHARETTGAGE